MCGGGTQAELSIVKLFEYFMNSRGISRKCTSQSLPLMSQYTSKRHAFAFARQCCQNSECISTRSEFFFYEEESCFKRVYNICIQISCHQTHVNPD